MSIYEQILAALKAKFQGVEVATLQRIASKRSKGVTDGSKVNSTVKGISSQDVLDSYGDCRAGGAQKIVISSCKRKHNIKGGKPIEGAKPQTPTPTPQSKPAEEVPTQARSLIDPSKTLSEKLVAMNVRTKADIRNQQIDEVAKPFGILEFAYKNKQVADDADLNQYFADLKQEMQNDGFQFVRSPGEGDHEYQNETNSIVEQTEKGTKEVVEQNNKQEL